jgi:hypothetical protein
MFVHLTKKLKIHETKTKGTGERNGQVHNTLKDDDTQPSVINKKLERKSERMCWTQLTFTGHCNPQQWKTHSFQEKNFRAIHQEKTHAG